MPVQKSHLAALAALCLAACGPSSTPTDDSGIKGIVRDDIPGLTQQYAEFRATQVENVRYRLTVELDPALDYFSGENRISFDRLELLNDLTIDFSGGDVSSISVNGTYVEVDYNESFIVLAASALLEGHNEIVIRFSHGWSDDGAGLYRYDDPDDGMPYLYTDFEPYDANSAFPLFDQPDIKGRFTLSVTAPNDWQVISASRESSNEQATESTRTWLFPETPPIPA